MSINRRELLGGMGSLGLLALFRKRGASVESPLVAVEDADITEEYEAYPSAVDIVVTAMSTFRTRRLVVPESIAPLWVLEDVLINQRSQFAALGEAIPAELFGPSQIGMDMAMDTAEPGIEIRMRVRRDLKTWDGKPSRFVAAIMGEVPAGDGEPFELYPGGPLVPTRRMKMAVLPISSDPFQVIR